MILMQVVNHFTCQITRFVGGYVAEVLACGQTFTSSEVRTKKIDAEQDAARLAFEHLQQQKNANVIDAGKS